ncbi:MAG: ester cyclase [Armatimonadetes bacterium]|nr:ester cyclase [Armatimonadota bacterium]
MSEKDNLQLAEQWIEAVNTQGFDVWGQLRAPGYLWEGPGLPAPAGPDAEDAYMKGAYQAFPDLHAKVLRMIAQGDLVVVNGVITATHKGPMTTPDGQTIPATGKAMSVPFSETLKFANGKIAHRTIYSDRLTQMAQLGLLPGA